MNDKKEDLRIKRTKILLYRALLELTSKQSFETITVKQICELAMVNRATFYKHFLDKYHLLSESIRELANKELMINRNDFSLSDSFQSCLNFANNYKGLFRQALLEEKDSLRGIIKEDMRLGISEDLAEKHSLDSGSMKLSLMTEAYLGALINMIMWCLENNITEITDEISECIEEIF